MLSSLVAQYPGFLAQDVSHYYPEPLACSFKGPQLPGKHHSRAAEKSRQQKETPTPPTCMPARNLFNLGEAF
jgi:hypothetical protein